MQKVTSRVASVVTSTVLAASVTVALGWPSHVNAVGNEEQATKQQAELAKQEAAPENAKLEKDASKIGDLEVTATLAKSETSPGRQVVHLECNNPTAGRIEGKIQLALTRTSGSGGERVMPRPQIAWRHNETVEVEPGAKLVREVMLPKNIGAEVARIEKLQQAAEGSETARYPNVYFGVVAEALEAPVTPASRAASVAPDVRPKASKLYATSASKVSALQNRNGLEFGY